MNRFMYPRVKGKYIAFCEGDDYWTDPLKLQKQVDFMEANEDIPCCFHRVDIFRQNENKFENGSLPKFIKEDEICEGKFFTNEDRLHGWFAYILAIMFRREYIDYLIENSKKYEFAFNDNHIIYYLMKDKKAFFFKDSMATYRINDGGIFGNKEQFYKENYSYNLTKEMYEVENNTFTKTQYFAYSNSLYYNSLKYKGLRVALKFLYKNQFKCKDYPIKRIIKTLYITLKIYIRKVF